MVRLTTKSDSPSRWIYFFELPRLHAVKIGITNRYDVTGRLRHCQTHNPDKIICRLAVWGWQSDETWIHRQLSHLNIRGEWFVLTGELRSFIASAVGAIQKRGGDRSPEWWKPLVLELSKRDGATWEPTVFTEEDVQKKNNSRLLSPRQRELLEVISRLTARAGYPPTGTEMATEMQLSRERVRQLLMVLQQRGIIKRSGGHTRSVVIAKKTDSTEIAEPVNLTID